MRFIILLILMVTAAVSLTAQGVSMSPTRLFFNGHPGETITETVSLMNESEKDYVLSIRYKDWERAEDGNKIYFSPGSLDHSNASWVSTLENTVHLPAKGRLEVVVTMKIPEGASGTEVTNSMLFFTQIHQQSDEVDTQGGIGVITLFEFGLHIYYTPPANNLKSLDITDIRELTEDTGKKVAAVSITNDGNVVNDATVEFELTNTDTGEEIKLDPRPISMMPDKDQVARFTLPEKLSGSYLGVVIIKMAGTNDLRVGEKTFEF